MASTSGTVTIDRPTSAPPPIEDTRIGALRPSPLLTSVSAANSTASSPAFPTRSTLQSSSRTKGMQLGANKVPPSIAAVVLAERLAEEATAEEESNPWGDDDLMDVNADEGDWSAFETAPPPVEVPTLAVVAPKPVPAPVRPGFNNGNGFLTRTPIPHAPSKTSTTLSPPPSTNDWDTSDDGWDAPSKSSSSPAAPASTAGMTKEEKAAEMARRKEERKQRIALLKEQKKNAGKS